MSPPRWIYIIQIIRFVHKTFYDALHKYILMQNNKTNYNYCSAAHPSMNIINLHRHTATQLSQPFWDNVYKQTSCLLLAGRLRWRDWGEYIFELLRTAKQTLKPKTFSKSLVHTYDLWKTGRNLNIYYVTTYPPLLFKHIESSAVFLFRFWFDDFSYF